MIDRRVGILAVSLLGAVVAAAIGQDNFDISAKSSVRSVPGIFQAPFSALGNRLKVKYKERTVFRGQLFHADGRSSSIQVTQQVPHFIRIEGVKAGGRMIAYDGRSAKGLADRTDAALLETFLLDMPDGIVIALQKSTELRLMGIDSGPDPDRYPDYDGPRYDVYSLSTQVDFRNGVWRHKLYYFDTKTKLLHKTEYKDQSVSPPVAVESHYSMWGSIDGSSYPAQISRYENGSLVFTFIAEEIEPGAGVAESHYR